MQHSNNIMIAYNKMSNYNNNNDNTNNMIIIHVILSSRY